MMTTTKTTNNEISKFDDDELLKELTFARGFGVYDDLSGNWLEELEAEAKERGLESEQ